MSGFLEAKQPAEIVERRFTPATVYALQGVTTSETGVTVDSAKIDGDDVVLTLSGGTAGATGIVTLTVTTSHETIEETLSVPIVASAAQIANTARQYVAFALRKVVGIGEDAEAEELDHGLEVLNALLETWREQGADIGAPSPVEANTVIYCPDYAVSALRYNLLIELAPVYGAEPTMIEYDRARRGLQQVKHKNLPAVRESEFF